MLQEREVLILCEVLVVILLQLMKKVGESGESVTAIITLLSVFLTKIQQSEMLALGSSSLERETMRQVQSQGWVQRMQLNTEISLSFYWEVSLEASKRVSSVQLQGMIWEWTSIKAASR